MAFAGRHPELIERMVVLNTGAFHLPNSKSFPPSLRLARVPAVGDMLVRGANAFVRGANRFCVTKNPLPKAVAEAYEAPHKNWADRVSVHEFVKDIPLSPSDPAYKLISETQDGLEKLKDKPMLIGWGMKDFVFDHHFLDEWERRFPDAEVHRFDDCGHFHYGRRARRNRGARRALCGGRMTALKKAAPAVSELKNVAALVAALGRRTT